MKTPSIPANAVPFILHDSRTSRDIPVHIVREFAYSDPDAEGWVETFTIYGDLRNVDHADLRRQIAEPERGAWCAGQTFTRRAYVVDCDEARTIMEQPGGRDV